MIYNLIHFQFILKIDNDYFILSEIIVRLAFACGKRPPCVRCGACCHIREDKFLTETEDVQIRKSMYSKAGIIYLYPMDYYTISLTHEERDILLKNAEERGIFISILPKKMMIIDGLPKVLDWFVESDDLCPFYDVEGHMCSVYEVRPIMCRLFPDKLGQNIFEDVKKLDDGVRLDFNTALEMCEEHVLKNYVSSTTNTIKKNGPDSLKPFVPDVKKNNLLAKVQN